MQKDKKQFKVEREKWRSCAKFHREASAHNQKLLELEKEGKEKEAERRQKAEEAEFGFKAIEDKNAETGDISISFFKNSPPKGVANKLYDFVSEGSQKVEVFSETNDLEIRTKILMFIRGRFGVLHPDSVTEKEIEDESRKELLSKLSKSELDDIEFQIKKAKEKKETNKEDEDWLRTELMINRSLNNEEIDEEIKDELEAFYEGEENERGLLRDTMRENKKLKEKYSRLGWIISTIVAMAILVIIGILKD